MRSMFKSVSRGMTGPRAMLALVGILSLVSGFALAADTDIVITEIMNNPDVLFDSQGEWFEIHNTGGTPVDLNGWTIQDNDTDLHVILGSAVVPGDGYAVLGIDAVSMAGEGVTLLYQYADIALANGGDELVLLNGSAVEIDRVEWDGGPVWPDLTGASMMWDEASGDNNVGGNWSPSTTVFGSGDLGTPAPRTVARFPSRLQFPMSTIVPCCPSRASRSLSLPPSWTTTVPLPRRPCSYRSTVAVSSDHP